MYYRARCYDPAVGRFISEDPLGFDAGDANLYHYVFNSPTNYTDPSGEAALVTLAAVGGVKAIKAVGAVLALGAGGVLLNNQLQSEETREALEDFAQRCLETVTGGYNPDFDPNRPIWDNLPLPQVDWGEILRTPPVNPEDLYPGGFGEGPQPEVDLDDLSDILRRTRDTSPTPQLDLRDFIFDSSSDLPNNLEEYLENLSKPQQRSVRSLSKRLREHEEKLEAYKANPEAFDNKKILKNAPNDVVRQKIIEGRIRHLEAEINAFTKGIMDIIESGDEQ
nr:RHS repeat-associated core domain-containing protein [Adonisia turfae]